MRIEEIGEQTLAAMSNTDLYNLRLRAVQIFNKHFEGTAAAAAGDLRRSDFLDRYEIVRKEMYRRGLRPTWEGLDDYLLRHKMMQGLDPTLMGEIVLEPACVIAGGAFASDPRGAEFCDLFVSPGIGFAEEIRHALDTRVTKQIAKPVVFHFGQESVGGPHMPLFDLVLRPRPGLEIVKAREDGGGQVGADRVLYCLDCGTSVLHDGEFAPNQVKCPDCGAFVGTAEPAISKAYADDELVVRKPGFEETENEIRYRVREPGRFQEDSFRRIALQQTRPRVYGIVGRLTGETTTTLQALRFPKGDGWTIPKARAWVSAHPDVLKRGSDLLKADVLKFAHNSTTRPDEPRWSGVDKMKLPRLAFAEMGDEGKVSTWNFPHHFVEGGGAPDDDGRYTTGTMYLHVGGLNAAWSMAQGGRAGAEASAEVKSHLNAHRKALGRKEASVGFEVRKVDEVEHLGGGVIYEPGDPENTDAQGDYTDAEEIRKGMYWFMENSQRIKVMHKGRAIQAKVLECFQAPVDYDVGGQTIKKGSWWLTVRVSDEEAWQSVVSGSTTGFSMGGLAREG